MSAVGESMILTFDVNVQKWCAPSPYWGNHCESFSHSCSTGMGCKKLYTHRETHTRAQTGASTLHIWIVCTIPMLRAIIRDVGFVSVMGWNNFSRICITNLNFFNENLFLVQYMMKVFTSLVWNYKAICCFSVAIWWIYIFYNEILKI